MNAHTHCGARGVGGPASPSCTAHAPPGTAPEAGPAGAGDPAASSCVEMVEYSPPGLARAHAEMEMRVRVPLPQACFRNSSFANDSVRRAARLGGSASLRADPEVGEREGGGQAVGEPWSGGGSAAARIAAAVRRFSCPPYPHANLARGSCCTRRAGGGSPAWRRVPQRPAPWSQTTFSICDAPQNSIVELQLA